MPVKKYIVKNIRSDRMYVTTNLKRACAGNTSPLESVIHFPEQDEYSIFYPDRKGGFAMTKAELINDVVYEMSGYLTSEGIDHLKTVITFKLVNINLTATETLPSTEIFDNEYIMKRYIIEDVYKRQRKTE